ncbi:hypothetical protein EI427_15590 [Flammeovirga pectinis]|uniref:G-D-S-L family lipolytic protein n=1 Tax=Flammeovirga pectinis TaxID=2494373 RepID=A0A3S9P600_9BACT|nr:hypothetical protein [Flammeovirga pectinis]AZQ63593.1 hypothetical protein EI427_15590 [Flammeovirga pectinis]
MTFNKYRSLLAAGAIALLSACTTEVDDFVTAGGSSSDGTPVDYTTYVALGNSLTSGYTDGAWVASAQVNSYPQLIARSLQEAGLGAKDFKQPLVSNSGKAYFGQQLILTDSGPGGLPKIDVGTSRAADNITAGMYHNMAVPGIRAIDMAVPGYGQANSNYGYFSSAATSTVLNDAIAAVPTFFSVWLGANDVLGFATKGGSLGPNNILNATAITPQSAYEQAMEGVLDGMMNNGAKGVILNVPDITEAAVFNTTPNTLEKMLAANKMELTEDFIVLVNGYLANAFDPVIAQGVEDNIKAAITKVLTPIAAIGNVNIVAYSVNVIQTAGGDVTDATLLATTVVHSTAFLTAKGTGASDADAKAAADAVVASEEGQTQIAQLVAFNINATWATYTGTETEVNTVYSSIDPAVIEGTVASTTASFKAAGYYPVFSLESNQLPVYDATSPTMMRVPAEGTLVSLLALSKARELGELILTGGDLDITKLKDYLPVIDNTTGTYEFLEKGDVDDVASAIDGYNAYLKQEASDRGLAYVDTEAIMSEAHDGGIIIDGVTYTTTYLSGNLFSLDGAHLTQRGYAVIGNYTLQAINAKYGAKLPQIQQNDFPVVETTVVPTPAAAN